MHTTSNSDASESPLDLEETIREFYKALVVSHDKQLESNSEDEGSTDEERELYLEKKAAKAAKAAEAEAVRKARLNPPEPDPNAPWDASLASKPKRRQRKKKKKSMKNVEDSVDEDEAEEFTVPDGDPFDLAKPVHTRMLTAVQVFRQNHRFTTPSSRMFSMYLTFGGMDEADQLSEDVEFEVDIEYVVASFLSHYLIEKAGIPDDAVYAAAPRVLHSFLLFLKTLRALPEYDMQVDAALQIAKTAQEELPLVKAINTDDLPNQTRFHAACHELFSNNGGVDMEALDELVNRTVTDKSDPTEGMREIVVAYVDVASKLGKETRLQGVHIVRRTLPMYMNIEAIDTDRIDGYGVLRLVPFISCDIDEEEQTEAQTSIEHLEITLPVDLANKIQPGMKMDGSFYELSNGLWFVEPLTLFPSYFRRVVDNGFSV